MTYPSSSPRKKNYSAFAWALLSQSIWLPVLVIDTQDRLASKNSDYDLTGQVSQQDLTRDMTENLAKSLSDDSGLLAATGQLDHHNSGVILNATLPGSNQNLRSEITIPLSNQNNHSPLAFSSPPSPKGVEIALQQGTNLSPASYMLSYPHNINSSNPVSLRRIYTNSELLGGVLSLQDLNEPEMPALARAERAQWSKSGDPLAPLPQIWRDSMRKALRSLSNSEQPSFDNNSSTKTDGLNVARVVHIPSTKVRHSTEVPLALQSDGSVDILNHPDDPAIVDEIKTWSSKQQLPSNGRMTPAIVHLHPLTPPADQLSTHPKTGNIDHLRMKSPPVNPPSKLAVHESISPEQGGTQSISRSESGSATATTVTDPGNSLPPQSVEENAGAASPTSEVKP